MYPKAKLYLLAFSIFFVYLAGGSFIETSTAYAQSVFDFDSEDDSEVGSDDGAEVGSQQEGEFLNQEDDEESIAEQQEQKEKSDQFEDEIISEEEMNVETESTPLEQRQQYSHGYFFWFGESKPLTNLGLGYTRKKNDRLFDSLSFGIHSLEYSRTDDGVSYSSSFDTYMFSADMTYYPFDTTPIKIVYGVSLGYIDGKFDSADDLSTAESYSNESFVRYAFTGYAGLGFSKILANGYFFGVDVLSSSKSILLGGEDANVASKIQENLDESLETMRIIAPLNLTFGKYL
jgi:hypothetical protein